MLGMLLSRNLVTHEALSTVIYGARPECDQPDVEIVKVQLCNGHAAPEHGANQRGVTAEPRPVVSAIPF